MADDQTKEDSPALLFNHRIDWVIDNQTDFILRPHGIWENWGNIVSHPTTVNENEKGPGGLIKASLVPGTGAAGIVGYTILEPAVSFLFLASNPNWKTEKNSTEILISKEPESTDKTSYNKLYKTARKEQQTSYIELEHGKLSVTSNIGQDDACVATFVINYEGSPH